MNIRTITLIFLATIIAACDMLDPRSSPAKIEAIILQNTPLGAAEINVLDFCSKNKLSCKRVPNHGYYYQPGGGVEPRVIGVTSIVAALDDYRNTPFSTVSTTVYWGFDSKNQLVGIWVWKTTDSL